MDDVSALIQWLWAPVMALGVSAAYFRSSRHMQFRERLAVSAHGAVIALLYLSALAMFSASLSRPAFAIPFAFLFLVPAGFIIYSVWRFKGNGSLHILQFVNFLSIAWTYFVGTMAITGEWL